MADAFFLYLRFPSDSAPVILGRPMVVPTEAWDSLFGGLPRSLSRSLAMTAVGRLAVREGREPAVQSGTRSECGVRNAKIENETPS